MAEVYSVPVSEYVRDSHEMSCAVVSTSVNREVPKEFATNAMKDDTIDDSVKTGDIGLYGKFILN
jgi:hypothetical protein